MTQTEQFIAATDRQLSFINSLLAEREIGDDHAARLRRMIENGELSKRVASDGIEWLKRQPAKNVTTTTVQTPTADVPAGRYAIEIDGTVKFYRVDKPTEGRWAGRTFVSVQASDDFHPVRGAAANPILRAIAVDPKAATIRYGHALGVCGQCGRTLTNEESIAAGIGPICAGRL